MYKQSTTLLKTVTRFIGASAFATIISASGVVVAAGEPLKTEPANAKTLTAAKLAAANTSKSPADSAKASSKVMAEGAHDGPAAKSASGNVSKKDAGSCCGTKLMSEGARDGQAAKAMSNTVGAKASLKSEGANDKTGSKAMGGSADALKAGK